MPTVAQLLNTPFLFFWFILGSSHESVLICCEIRAWSTKGKAARNKFIHLCKTERISTGGPLWTDTNTAPYINKAKKLGKTIALYCNNNNNDAIPLQPKELHQSKASVNKRRIRHLTWKK